MTSPLLSAPRRGDDEAPARRERFLKAALGLLLAWALVPRWGTLPALLDVLW